MDIRMWIHTESTIRPVTFVKCPSPTECSSSSVPCSPGSVITSYCVVSESDLSYQPIDLVLQDTNKRGDLLDETNTHLTLKCRCRSLVKQSLAYLGVASMSVQVNLISRTVYDELWSYAAFISLHLQITQPGGNASVEWHGWRWIMWQAFTRSFMFY